MTSNPKQQEETEDADAIELALSANYKQELFKYFRIIELRNSIVLVECQMCKNTLKDSVENCAGLRRHLQVLLLILNWFFINQNQSMADRFELNEESV